LDRERRRSPKQINNLQTQRATPRRRIVMSASDPGATIKDERVNGIIADYLRAIERGEVPDRAALLARHAEFTTELSAFFADHDRFRQVAAPLAEALTLPPGE